MELEDSQFNPEPDIEAYLNPEFPKFEINPGHYLELMDRLHVVLTTINDHILNHPLTMQEADITTLVEQAMEKLADAYQLVGTKEQPNE